MIAVGWIHDRHREIARPWVHLNKVVGARGSPDDSNGERGASAAAASAVRAPRVGDVKYRHITYTSLAPRAGKRFPDGELNPDLHGAACPSESPPASTPAEFSSIWS